MTNLGKEYDYIIAGAGASGLSLLMYLMEYPEFKSKQVLLLDKDDKKKNDRTWCFWQKEESPFEGILTTTWDELYFHSAKNSKLLNINPYQYKMIKGIDFYNYCFLKIKEFPNIEFIKTEINSISNEGFVICENHNFRGKLVFNSAKVDIPEVPRKHYLLQHFKGWMIETIDDQFDPDRPILMDFRVQQSEGCDFVYVLPLSKRKAFVEYTIFSDKLLEKETYDQRLKNYIGRFLNIKEYEISEQEFGVIPMTNAPIKERISDKVINIGTAGGYTKASTGYTFSFLQKYCKGLADDLMKTKQVKNRIKKSKRKYHFYDSILLRVIAEQNYPAWKIFDSMFTKLPSELILDFLDENTNLFEDLRIMNAVHKTTFIKAAFNELKII